MEGNNDKVASGYIRVSTKTSAQSGESLVTQKKDIKDYIQKQGWTLGGIYEDAGISGGGGSMDRREGLQRLLRDAQDGKFSILVIHRLSRFGRNARDLLNNVEMLKDAGVQLRSIKEGIDFSSPYGKAMLTMLGAIAELEREIIRETTLENRIARANQGLPSVGRAPYARVWDAKKKMYILDKEKPNKVKAVREAARRYLQGGSLRDIAGELIEEFEVEDLRYHNLLKVLKGRLGDRWIVEFEAQEKPIVYKMERILDKETERAVQERIAHNTSAGSRNGEKYVLSGYLKCWQCRRALSGQTQKSKSGKTWKYYRHERGKHIPCKHFSSINLEMLERACFELIFFNTIDEPAFNEAIKDSLPNESRIQELQDQISAHEKALAKIEGEIESLYDWTMQFNPSKDVYKNRESSLFKTRDNMQENLRRDQAKLDRMPNPEEVKRKAEKIRLMLLDRFYGKGAIENWYPIMTLDDKRRLLDFCFSGKDEDGNPLGIYIQKSEKKEGNWEIFFNGRMFSGWEHINPEIVGSIPVGSYQYRRRIHDRIYGE